MPADDRTIEELTLLLLYLTSWTETGTEGGVRRAWKGYPFDALDGLEAKGMISQRRGAKSVHLTSEGISKAEDLEREYVKQSDS